MDGVWEGELKCAADEAYAISLWSAWLVVGEEGRYWMAQIAWLEANTI
jgi:hypothetical protein